MKEPREISFMEAIISAQFMIDNMLKLSCWKLKRCFLFSNVINSILNARITRMAFKISTTNIIIRQTHDLNNLLKSDALLEIDILGVS